MAQKVVSIELVRDGQCTPWGFRLKGGVDIGSPLYVERVFFGSPSDGDLKRGDVIARIRDADATKLSHKQAIDLIAKAGNTIKLVVVRSGGPTPISPPVSPAPMLAGPGTPVIMYHLSSMQQSGNSLPFSSPPGSEHLFQPLPTTQFPNATQNQDRGSIYYSYLQQGGEAKTEKAAITHQAYRTLPLITPGCKTSKDTPVGSYLRFTYDTKGHNNPQGTYGVSQKINEAYMLTRVQEAVLDAASNSPRASVSSGRTPTPEMSLGMTNGPQVYHRQYNSPINIYSNQAIMDTINAQTATVTKEHDNLGGKVSLSPSPITPMDISKSPTYQMIHEQEDNMKNVKEHRPPVDRVYNPMVPGIPTDKIYQSGSFNTLMTSMQGLTEF